MLSTFLIVRSMPVGSIIVLCLWIRGSIQSEVINALQRYSKVSPKKWQTCERENSQWVNWLKRKKGNHMPDLWSSLKSPQRVERIMTVMNKAGSDPAFLALCVNKDPAIS